VNPPPPIAIIFFSNLDIKLIKVIKLIYNINQK
jgi:hypothetical protein